jgi:hypothetical protein
MFAPLIFLYQRFMALREKIEQKKAFKDDFETVKTCLSKFWQHSFYRIDKSNYLFFPE